MNVLTDPKRERTRGEHGWYTGGVHSYDWLLSSPVVKDWLDGYTNESTRSRMMYQFEKVLLASRRKDPADLLKLSDPQAKSVIKRVARFYLQQGKGVWARQIQMTMRGFYEAHDREIKFKRAEKIRTPASKKIGIQHIPTKTDVYRMVDVAGSLRNRAMLLCLFESGVRVGCLCRWYYGMVEKQLYPKTTVPVTLRITQAEDTKLALQGLPYYVTFLHDEAAQALKDHIDERKRRGWKPGYKDLIFVTESSASRGEPLDPVNVWEVVKSSARMAGLRPESIWTHVFRKSFRKVLNETPEISEDAKEALMGHRLPGSRGSYYDFHDIGEAAREYDQADWTRDGSRQLSEVQDQLDKIRKVAEEKELEVRSLKEHISILRTQQESGGRQVKDELTRLRKSLTEKEDLLDALSKGQETVLAVTKKWRARIERLEQVQRNHPLGPGTIFHQKKVKSTGKLPAFTVVPISEEDAAVYSIPLSMLGTQVDPKTGAPLLEKPRLLLLHTTGKKAVNTG